MIIINFLQVVALIALNLLAIASIIVGFVLMLMFVGFSNAVCSHQVEMMQLKEEKIRKELGKEPQQFGLHGKEVKNEA